MARPTMKYEYRYPLAYGVCESCGDEDTGRLWYSVGSTEAGGEVCPPCSMEIIAGVISLASDESEE